jgi:predicted transposase/invertase (TIGR01784 family)
MEDKITTESALSDVLKTKIQEWCGIDVDSDLFSPMVDYIFKRVFTAEDTRSKIALIDLLNSVLKFEGTEKIVDLIVMNPEIPVDIGTRKKAIFDIRVKFNDGLQAIVEMQISGGKSFKKRSQFVISKAYSSQEISGEKYSALQKCYLICIINFTLLEEPVGLVTDYLFRDVNGRELTDDETILFIQLPEVDKILDKSVGSMSAQEMWAIFFRYMADKSKRDKLNEIIGRKEGIKMAANMLYEISQDEQARIQYENELLADLDVRSWVSDALEDGYKDGFENGFNDGKKNGILKGKLEGKIEGKKEGKKEGRIEGIDTTLLIIDALNIQTSIEEIAAMYQIPIEQIARIQSALGL